jgi:hypothetical protein
MHTPSAVVVLGIPEPIPVAVTPRLLLVLEHHLWVPAISAVAASKYLHVVLQVDPVDEKGVLAT